MAELYFKVGADYQEVIRLRKECERLEAQIKKTGNSDPSALRALTERLDMARVSLGEMVTQAAKAGASMKELNKAAGADAMSEYAKSLSSIFKQFSQLAGSTRRVDVFREMSRAIEANTATIARNEAQLEDWSERAKRAFAEGDLAVFDSRIRQIEQLTEQTRALRDENEKLGAIRSFAAGNAASPQGGNRFFVREEDYDRAKQLEGELTNIRIKMTEVAEGSSEMTALTEELQSAREELQGLNEDAEMTAAILGSSLGGKASEVSSSLYELNSAISAQEYTVERLKEQLADAKANLDALRASSSASEEGISEAADAYESLREKVSGATARLHEMRGAQKDAEENMDSLRDQIGHLGEEMEDAGSKAGDMVKSLLAVGGLSLSLGAVKSFGQSILDTREKFEDMQSTISTFLGSAEKGAQFFSELKDYAWFNMDSFENLTAASEQLIAYGNDVNDLIEIIDQLSNVASATHRPLMQYVDLFNKAKAAGRVDARDLQSWKAAGFMITDVLKEAGEQVEGTTVSFLQLQKALKIATSEGGFFNGVMDNMLQNTSALKGQLEDDITSMKNEIGESLQGPYNEVLKTLDKMVNNYQDLGKVLLSVVGTYGAYKAAILISAAALKAETGASAASVTALRIKNLEAKKSITMTEAMTLAQLKFNAAVMANPWTLLVVGVAAATAGLIAYERSLITVENEQRRANAALGEGNAAATEEVSLLKRLQYELEQTAEGSAEYSKTRKKIIDLYGKYDSQLEQEADMVKYLKENYDALRESIIAANREKAFDNYIRDLDDAKEQSDARLVRKIQKKLDKTTGENSGVYGIRIAEFASSEQGKAIGELRAEIKKLGEQLYGYQEERDPARDEELRSRMAEANAELAEKMRGLTSILDEARKDGLTGSKASGILDKVMTLIDDQYVNDRAHDYAEREMRDPFMESMDKAFSALDDPETLVQIKRDLLDRAEGFLDFVMEPVSFQIGGQTFEFKTKEEMVKAAAGVGKRLTELSNKPTPSRDPVSEAAYQRRKNEEANAKELAKLVQKNEYDVEQARIDAMDDGLGKTLAKLRLDNRREVDEIERQAADRLKALQDQEMQVWLKGDSTRKAKDFVSTIKTLPAEWDEVYRKMKEIASQNLERHIEEALLPYDTIEKQRSALETAIDRQVSEIRALGEERAAAVAEAMKEVTLAAFDEKNLVNASRESVRKAREASMKAAEAEFAIRNPEDVEGLGRLRARNRYDLARSDYDAMKDFSSQTKVLGALTRMLEAQKDTIEDLDEAQWELYRNGALTDWARSFAESGVDRELKNFSDNLANLSLDDMIVEVDLLENELDFLEEMLGDDSDAVVQLRAKILLMKDAIKDFRQDGSEAVDSLTQKWSDLVSVLSATAQTFSDVGDLVGESWGGALKTMGALVSSAGQAVTALQQLKEAQKTSRDGKVDLATRLASATSIIGAMMSVTSLVVDSIRGMHTAADDYYRSMRVYNHEMAMSMAGLQGEYDSIFGSDAIGKMHEYYEDWLAYQAKANEAPKGFIRYMNLFYLMGKKQTEEFSPGEIMKNVMVQIQHGTWFSRAKSSSLGLLFPELFNADGSVNRDNLGKAISAIEELGQSANDSLLQELKSLQDYYSAADEALQSLKDSISAIFGNLADEIGSGIIDAVRNGADAMSAMEDAGLSVIDALENQMVRSMLLNYMDQFQDRMLKAAGTGGEQDLVSVLDEMFAGMGDVVNGAMTAAELFEQRAREQGWEMDRLSASYQQQATAGGFTTMSQDEASELSGRFAALQMAGESIRGYSESLSMMVGSLEGSFQRGLSIADESRELMAMSLLELRSISESTQVVVRPIREMGAMVEDIRRTVMDKL